MTEIRVQKIHFVSGAIDVEGLSGTARGVTDDSRVETAIQESVEILFDDGAVQDRP